MDFMIEPNWWFLCEFLFYLVIVIEDDVVEFEGEVHHKTSDVQDWPNIHMSDGASSNYSVGV